jgi:mono/diheme cytochrome c family protein
MRSLLVPVLVLVPLTLLLGGCPRRAREGAARPGAPGEGLAEPAAIARDLYATRCVACHGASGHGDGPAAMSMNPRPRDFADPAWQRSVTDDYLRRVITGGGLAVGKSPLMPPNPDLGEQPQVLDALVAHLRSFGAR